MVGVDLFAGAGGMSLGAREAGVDVRVAVESDPWAADTYARNHPFTHVICEDVARVRATHLPKADENTILFGGPPCQGFSTSNQRTRGTKNLGNWLFLQFMRLVDEWEPSWVVFENVRGIMETENGQFLDCVVRVLESSGYRVSHWVLNALDFGVPQRRYRVFVIGSLHGKSVEQPTPTTKDPTSVSQALTDLPLLSNGAAEDWMPYRQEAQSEYAHAMRGRLTKSANHVVTKNAPYILERYRHVPQGGNWQDIPLELITNYKDRTRCHTGIYHRLKEDAPSVVVGNYRKNMLIHPWQDRGLSVREAARLQSFPDSYVFTGSIGFQQQQVGNAVPPLLARAVFTRIGEVM
jgi:DNA (cytosine-5)-methyltransferase 1